MADTIEVIWSTRERAWFARGFGFPWRRVSRAHLAENESDVTLGDVVRPMFTAARGEGRLTPIRRLGSAWRLPKDPT